LLNRPLFLYYEPRRMIATRQGHIGLSRSMLCSSPRFDKSFLVRTQSSVLFNIWSYNQVDQLVQNQFAWNVDAPGAQDNFIWPDRLCPRDGDGNAAFYGGTLLPICIRVFGARAGPRMLELFKLKLQTAFLLQPTAIATYFENNRKTPHSSAPAVDFDALMQEQSAKVIEADRIMSELSQHPGYFTATSQQREFARYYKEVKLLRWLVPINLAKRDALRAMGSGQKQRAQKEIDNGLKAVEQAREHLARDIAAIKGFSQWNPGRIVWVPVGPKASDWWNPEYLDKYFVSELQAMRKGVSAGVSGKTGEPLTQEDTAAVRAHSLVAAKTIVRLKLDGRLIEPAWQKAKRLPLVKVVTKQNPDLVYPHARGWAKACWDKGALYIGMVFSEDEMDSLVGTTGSRDRFFFTDDIFELFIQPRASGPYGHLVGNIAGSKWDAIPKKTALGFANYTKWNPDWEYAVHIDLERSRWQIEARIPFDVFGRENFGEVMLPPKGKGAWRINLGRERRTLEYSAIIRCMSFHDIDKYARLVFANE